MKRNLPQVDKIQGWFSSADQVIFSVFLQMQLIEGDILEIGVFKGKSAIFLEYFRRDHEILYVCDLFENQGVDSKNRTEVERSYEGLSFLEFKSNFLRFHKNLPEIKVCDSKALSNTLKQKDFRFIHIDGSHLYDFVRSDLDLSISRIRENDGIIAMDDFRSAHTAGVAAAMWESVARRDLVPVVITSTKAYLARDNHEISLDSVESKLLNEGLEIERVEIGDIEFLRVIDNFNGYGNYRFSLLRKFLPPVLVFGLRSLRDLLSKLK